MNNFDELEAALHDMDWEQVSLEPDSREVEALDQQLPDAWLSSLEREAAFDREILDPLLTMSDQELQQQLVIPEGDIDQNAHQALAELEFDVEGLLREIERQEQAMESLERAERDRDDFGR